MSPPLLKHSSHPLCGSAVVWCEATYVVTGVIAATVVVVTTVVASCPAEADRTAAMANGENSAPRQATRRWGSGRATSRTTRGRPSLLVDPESERNGSHIAIIVVVDPFPSKGIFAQGGRRPNNHCIQTPARPEAQLKTARGQRDDGHRPSNHGSGFCGRQGGNRCLNVALTPTKRA